jgi:cellulose synthase operon protein C
MTSRQSSSTQRRLSGTRLLAQLIVAGAGLGCGASSFAVDSKAAKFYEDALVRYEKKDVSGAIIQLKNALQIDANMLPVQVLLGKALLSNGEVAAAEVALTEALRIGVNRAEVVVPLAQSYIAQGKHKLLLEQQQFQLSGLPAPVQLQMLLIRAAAYTDLGDARNALKSVDEARAIDPKSAAPWLTEVPLRIRSNQLREAADATERALALAPDASDAWYQKGAVLHVTGKLGDALAAYDRALKADAENIEARISRAGILIDLGKFPEAASDVAELLRLRPREPRASYLQALLAERDNKPEVAQRALKSIVELIDPVPMEFIRYRPQLLMLNGLAHYGLNEAEKAKQYLEFFQKVQGNTPTSKLLARLYLADGNVDRAIEVLEVYLKAVPEDGQAMALLGSALMSKGQHAKASALMTKALAAKDSPEFRTVLGISLFKGGKAGDAVAELEAARKANPRQKQATLSLIAIYLQSGQAAKAAALAEGLVKEQPGNPGYVNLLGLAKSGVGDQAGAKAAFEQAVKIDPSFVMPKLNLARLEMAARSYDAAATRLNAILATDDKNTDAMLELATLHERRGQFADAQRWLEKTNDLAGPKEFRWSLALADFHLRRGQPGPALEAVKKASAKAPEDITVLIAYARVQLAGGDTVGAKNSLTTATRVADYNPVPQLQIALLQLSANNVGGAAYSLEKGLSTQPNYLPAQALMVDVELRQGDPAKAEKRARDIITQHPKRAVGHSLLGDVALARGQTAAATDAYRKAHQLEPSTDTLLRLFRILSAQEGGKAAAQLGEQWLKAHPKDVAVQRALADLLAHHGNFKQAKTAYEAVLQATPNDSGSLNNLANVLLQLKDPAAVKVAEQALSKQPDNPRIIDTLGWALHQNGQTDKALQYLRDARLREPGNPEIRYHLAVVLAQTGRKTEARDELEVVAKSTTAFEGSAEAAALLKSLK